MRVILCADGTRSKNVREAGYPPIAMRGAYRLFIVVEKAALIVAVGYFALLALTLYVVGLKGDSMPIKGEILVGLAVFLPIGASVWWIFRKLQTTYPRREARAVSIAFGVFTPISLLVATILGGPILGGYADMLVRSRFSVLVGIFVGTVATTGFLSFLVCA
jgi:Na+/citrate or Na+/malate symporter